FDEGAHRRLISADRVVDAGVDLGDRDLGMLRVDPGHAAVEVGSDFGVARAFGAGYGECHNRLTVEQCEGARLGDAIPDDAELIEPDLAISGDGDCGACQFLGTVLSSERPDRLLTAADVAFAAGEVNGGGAQLPADVS